MRVLQLAVPPEAAELAADRLWQAGARAVEEVELPEGRIGLRTVIAGDDAVTVGRLGELPPDWRTAWLELDDEPAQTWRAFAVPIDVGDDLVIRPAWLDPIGDGRLEVAIEPGGSFGLGDHPTTRLTASAVVRLVRGGSRVLDVGCGSGVLAVIAARLGATEVVGVDIAEAAVEATEDNARRNGVAGVVRASSTPVGDVAGEFDVVVANVLAPTLVAMADDLRRLTGSGGALVISGVLASAHDHVVAALAPMRAVRTDVLGAWAAVELRR